MMLFIILLWPDFEADAARPEQYDDWIAGCSNLDEIEKQELDEIIELFENEEVKKIENRINGLLDSKKQLEMEKNLAEKSICYAPIGESYAFTGAFNLYHSLLTYAEEIEKSKDGKITELSVKLTEDEVHQLDAILDRSGKEIHIDHFYSNYAGTAFLDLENRKKESELKKSDDLTSIVSVLTLDIAERTYQVIQNPVEKALSVILSYFEREAEKEHEIFRKEASLPSMSYDLELSIIEVDAGTGSQELMKEYYPTKQFLNILKRWEAVTHIAPQLKYPEEAIEKGDWNDVAEKMMKYGKKFKSEEIDLHDFIISGSSSYLTNEESEELIRKVDDIERVMQ